MSLVKRARLVVAAAVVAVSGAAVVAPHVTAAQHPENGGGNNTPCHEQVTEYRYARDIPVYKTEYLYKKQIRDTVTHQLADGDNTVVGEWTWWDAGIPRWSVTDVEVLESGPFGEWWEADGDHTDHYVREYRFVKSGESRQVLVQTDTETTDWLPGPPDGEGWEQIDQHTVDGDEIPCGEPPSFPPDVVEQWDDCAAGDTEVTGTRTTTSYRAVYNFDTDTWDKVMDGEPVVETISRPLNDDEAEACAPDETTTTTTTTTTPPSTDAPTVRIAAVTPVCHKAAPYIEVTLGGDADFNGRAATISFVDVHGTTVATHAITFNVGDTVRFIYPGATVDADGNPTDWPGWKYSNGQWVPDSTDAYLRQGLTVVLTVNPTDTASVHYPGVSAGCNLPENVSPNPVPADSSSGFTLPETL